MAGGRGQRGRAGVLPSAVGRSAGGSSANSPKVELKRRHDGDGRRAGAMRETGGRRAGGGGRRAGAGSRCQCCPGEAGGHWGVGSSYI